MSEQFDLMRIFFGDTTWMDVAEIVFRTTVLFFYTLLLMRMIGHRGIGQLSMAEFVVILALGSAVGDPMFYADVPLIHGILVITVIVLYQVGVTYVTMRSQPLALMIDGSAIRLVVDGMIDIHGLKASRLTHGELFGELRQFDIRELGEIERAYLETDGKVSVFRYAEGGGRLGLPLLPPHIENYFEITWGETITEDDQYACLNCGNVEMMSRDTVAKKCPRCHKCHWTVALKPESAKASLQ